MASTDDVSTSISKGALAKQRSQKGRHRGNTTSREFDATLKVIQRELSQKSIEIATRLLECNEVFQSVSVQAREIFGRNDSTQEFLTKWRKLASDFDQAVSQTRLFAVDGSSTIADFLTSVTPYLLDPENSSSDKSLQVQSYLELLRSADAREDAIKPNVADVLSSMDTCLGNNDLRSLLEPAKSARLSVEKLLTPIKLDPRMVTLLDNSSIPGFMNAMVGLLPKETVKRISKVLDGESNAVIENVDGPSTETRSTPSQFDCLMDIRNILRLDLLAAVKGDQDFLSSDNLSRIEMIKALYKALETSLGEFARLLADGTQGRKHAPVGTPTRFKVPRFLRRLWPYHAEKH